MKLYASGPQSLRRKKRALDHSIRVTVDGVDVTRDCVAFDTREGWAEVFERDKEGHWFIRNNRIARHRIHGRVRVAWLRAAPRLT